MPNAIYITFTAVTALLAVPGLVRQLQMLQQNSYFAIRYLRWYKGTFNVKTILTIIISLLSIGFALSTSFMDTVTFTIGVGTITLYLLISTLVALGKNKTSIKKLVLTARVKRMFFAAAVLFAALAVLACVFYGSFGYIFLAALCFLATLPSLSVIIVLFVTKPIEKIISNYYINDAKKILKSMKGLKVIGVTGSYGKTSTKFILGRILSEKYNTLVTPENYNTPMGVVITIRNYLRPTHEVFVVEMGAKRKGDIAEVCEISGANYGIITSVGPQHLDTFGNIETVVSTKFELADRVMKSGGKVLLNTDNEYIKTQAEKYNSITYGTNNANVIAKDISYSPEGLTLTINSGNLEFKVTSKLLGQHNALNIAGAAAMALELGLTPEQIAFAVSKIKPIEHRLQLKPYINGATLIDDAYNSNPEGCLEAVRVLGSFDGMKKILVTPGLVELGEKEYEYNKRLGVEAAKHADIIILVGKKRSVPIAEGIMQNGEFNKDNLYTVSSFAEAMGIFSKMCDNNTAILFENDLPDNYLE